MIERMSENVLARSWLGLRSWLTSAKVCSPDMATCKPESGRYCIDTEILTRPRPPRDTAHRQTTDQLVVCSTNASRCIVWSAGW